MTKAGLSQARLARIGEWVEARYIAPGRLAGAQALVARHGHVAYAQAFGRRDVERDLAWTDNTIVRIYSMTKPVVSVALMMLFERGLFQLDDPIVRVLPEWAGMQVWREGAGGDMRLEPPRRPITFRHLMTHTAGLTYGALLESVGAVADRHPVDQAYVDLKVARDPGQDLDAFVSALGRTPLRYQPGERWQYSLATDVLGALVQRLSGRSLDRFLHEEIFGPLGMVDTGFHVPAESASRLAACYMRTPKARMELQDDPAGSRYLKPPVFLSGGGGLVSTLEDYRRFCEMVRRGGEFEGARILGRPTLRLMMRNHLPGGAALASLAIDGFSETTPLGVGFGLGFAAVENGAAAGSPSEGDVFWGGAASTLFWVDPREDLVVIFLTQLMPSTTYNLRGQLKTLVYAAFKD